MSADMTKFQKLMLINAYPVKMVFNSVGGIGALYFLWEHELLYAIILGGIFIFSGTLLASKSKASPIAISETFLGKIFLRYSTKWGFVCYLVSHALIPISFWFHNMYLAVLGALFLLIGLMKFKPGL